ncbi:MAG: class I SAM-dependent methyltransferase [Nanoarchaeota archaeon]
MGSQREQAVQRLKKCADLLLNYEAAEREITENTVAEMLALESGTETIARLLGLVAEDIEAGCYGLDWCKTDLQTLQEQTETLTGKIAAKREIYFSRWQEAIRNGNFKCRDLEEELASCLDPDRKPASCYDFYDEADKFVTHLLDMADLPTLSPGYDLPDYMRRYHASSVFTIYEATKRVPITGQDVFYDLGSGYGRVPILTNLLTGARTTGIEYFQEYHQRAKRSAKALGLRDVSFIQGDAADADYAGATVFFLFNSFYGKILDTVVRKMEAIAQERAITLCTVNMRKWGNTIPWLKEEYHDARRAGLTIFRSRNSLDS